MPEIAYINGTFLPVDQAVVPIGDRGYHFGDGVYEFVASYNGRLFCLEEHMDRLQRSMTALSFPPVSIASIRQTVCELYDRGGIDRAAVYIQISRGIAPREHGIPKECDPQIVMTVRKVREKPKQYREHGASAITVSDFRWGRCDIKTIQLLPNVMAKQKALDAGAFDAIFVSEDNIVREATSSNVFIVKNRRLATHPLTRHILNGITRGLILDICRQSNFQVDESFYTIEDLHAADEVFLTGTTTELLPVVTVDEKPVGEGKVGPVSKQLYQKLLERIKEV
jgi:D-alanine transaminase